MKKYLLCLMLSFLLVGCFGNKDDNNVDLGIESTITESEPLLEEIITVNGTEVNLKDEGAVIKLYDDLQKELKNKSLKVELPEKSYTFGYEDFGVEIDLEKVKEDVKNKKTNIILEYAFDEEAINTVINTIAEENDRKMQNASFSKTDRGTDITSFSFSEGVPGKMINKEKLNLDIKEAINTNDDIVVVVLEDVAPDYTLEDMKGSVDMLASSSTDYSKSAADRNQNLGVATEKINNRVVYPGEIFSTAAAYGPINEANGFKVSKVIQNNELVDGIGGGVCQISSTLYNATLKSELEIVERVNHSLKVGYMNYAFDATMAEGWIDYRFKNNTEYPILIESYLDTEKKNVVVNIYGKETRPANRTIELTSKFISSWEPDADEIKYDSTMYADEEVYEKKPVTGVKYDLYKNIYIDGVFQESVWLNSSSYSSVKGIKKVGTKPVSERPAPTTTETPSTESSTSTETPAETSTTEETPQAVE